MDNIKIALLKSLIHALEILIVLIAVWFVITFLGLADTEFMPMVYAALASGVVKLIRTWGKSPIGDYVNNL